MLAALTDLHLLTGNDKFSDYARRLHDAFASSVRRVLIAHASFLAAFEHHSNPVQAVFVGSFEDVQQLRAAVLANYPALLIYSTDGNDLPSSHVAYGKAMLDGKPTVYICTGQTCSLPINNPALIGNQST